MGALVGERPQIRGWGGTGALGGMDGRMAGDPPINPRKQQVRARCSLLTAQEGRARVVIINNH